MILKSKNAAFRVGTLAIVCLGVVACKSTETHNYHQQTLNSLAQTEQRIIEQIANVESQRNQDSVSLTSLRSEVNALKEQLSATQALLTEYVNQQTDQTAVTESEAQQTIVTERGDFVLGAIEHVTVEAIQQTFEARIDTGAATSSINAVDIEFFERNGDDWVRFHILDESNQPSDSNWVETPVIRFVNIRQVSSTAPERRPVVKLWTQLGEMRDHSEFTLADRSHMSHPVLLGREYMRDVAIVDVSKEFVQSNPE
ncbi:ATP-dependent zinc protease [Alteromonas sp. ASW11-36]|uniref:ATP-dependent zinc protease n=1 Tax=Alteromonas arenosi TaxID=3055817 RepID=A0ABT7SSR6_9ALTE|nr:ATP-dependent zinc protease [Alteromonas sp. ASW11-36]MDM7859238.1 ATP-dependent zinc protease [Alteromonas sp. ASW11-36]